MATVYISEYGTLGISNVGPIPVAPEPAIADQTISITGSSAQSSAFSANTRYIRVHTDSICSILVGTNPTALLTSKRLNANQTEYFAVAEGAKLAAIVNT